MEAEDRKAFIADYLVVQTEAKELLAYKNRFEAFCGFIEQAECVRVVKSRERPGEKLTKYFLIVKKPTQPILIVKLSPYGPLPESGDTLYWTQPKDSTDEVVLLVIKKTDSIIELLKEKFKNADGKTCRTMFFVEPQKNYHAVRVRLDEVNNYLDNNRAAFEAASEGKILALNIKTRNSGLKTICARSI